MIGILVNCGTVIGGSILGAVLKKGIPEEYKEILMQTMGLIVSIMGISFAVNGICNSIYHVLFIISLAIGALIGQKLNLEDKLNHIAKQRYENSLIEGLSTAILLFCVGTFAILGPIESFLNGDNTMLYTNAMVCGIASVIFASTYGIGIIISAVILFLEESLIYLSTSILSVYLTPCLLNEMSIIGGVLILCSGFNILNLKKIKVLNLLPALFIPAIFFIIKGGC